MRDFQRDLEFLIENAKMITKPEIKFQFRKYKRIEDRPIDDLGLDLRPYNGLRMNGLRTIGDIVDHWVELINMRSVGERSNKSIKNAVLSYYYDTLNEEERQQFWYDAFEGGEN